jgi:hypothetical protein
MKTLTLIISLMLAVSNNSNACEIAGNEVLSSIIEAAAEVKAMVENDNDYLKIGNKFSSKSQEGINAAALEPINFNEEKHRLDYYTLGNIEFIGKDKYGSSGLALGSAIKVGKSCVLTTAHTFYDSGFQEMQSSNQGEFKGNIAFVIGSGKDAKKHKASVYFQMTKEGIDFKTENYREITVADGTERLVRKRNFYGHHDLILLRLENYSDQYFKKTLVINPKKLFNGVDEEVGKKISCHGSPVHMTSQTYGSCKGSDLKWKQENARVFADDINSASGVYTNTVTSEGMSGGPCYLNENSEYVFGLVSGGYIRTHKGELKFPEIKFNTHNYQSGNVRYIGLLHVLDERLKAELGYGLDKISENCK